MGPGGGWNTKKSYNQRGNLTTYKNSSTLILVEKQACKIIIYALVKKRKGQKYFLPLFAHNFISSIHDRDDKIFELLTYNYFILSKSQSD